MGKNQGFMKIALGLAARGKGKVSPNPLVGCVIVKNGKIMGKGFHEKWGNAHAEVNALRNAGKKATNSEMYVTLEPCVHFGKTPPCADAIIKSGIKKVYIAMKDPNPKANGKGIAKLVKAGIKVDIGILRKEAGDLNEKYVKFITKKIPFVCMKVAMGANGKITYGNGKRKKITGKESLRRVHELKNEYGAVLVGVNTVLKDNPRLTCRIKNGKNPVRIVLDSKLKLRGNERIFREQGKIIIAATKKASFGKVKKLRGFADVLLCRLKNGKVDLKDLMKKLAKKEIASVLVEGGKETNESFLREGIADRIMFFVAPRAIKGKALNAFEWDLLENYSLEDAKVEISGEDILIQSLLKK